MKRCFLVAVMLCSGIAAAQSGSSPGQAAQAQQQPSMGQKPATSPGTESDARTSAGQTLIKGCLKQSGGNWVLAAENGQTVNLSGESSMLKPHDGQEVQVEGTQANDGSFHVSSVGLISDSCTSPR